MAWLESNTLTRRERQVMEVLYRLGEATVAELRAEMPEDVSYSAVRSVLRVLREKELVQHRSAGPRYAYSPMVPAHHARQRALEHLVRTFFDGSAEAAAAMLLNMTELDLSDEALGRIVEHIRQAQEEGR